jgi:hypothetical protein
MMEIAMGIEGDLSDTIRADLEQVRFLALRHSIWDLSLRKYIPEIAGVGMRRELMRLYSLKQVILVQ